MSRYKPGDRVLITQDCRDGAPATGQTGIYEGMFPFSVVFTYDGQKWSGEYSYEDYESGDLRLAGDSTPAKEVFPLWQKGKPRPEGPFAMAMDNPRIRLDDGSTIWGCQCWWSSIEEEPPHTMEEETANLERHKDFLRDIGNALWAVVVDKDTRTEDISNAETGQDCPETETPTADRAPNRRSSPSDSITNRDLEILGYVELYLDQYPYAPTRQEIADALGYRAKSAVQPHLERLRDAGLLTWQANTTRTLQLVI